MSKRKCDPGKRGPKPRNRCFVQTNNDLTYYGASDKSISFDVWINSSVDDWPVGDTPIVYYCDIKRYIKKHNISLVECLRLLVRLSIFRAAYENWYFDAEYDDSVTDLELGNLENMGNFLYCLSHFYFSGANSYLKTNNVKYRVKSFHENISEQKNK